MKTRKYKVTGKSPLLMHSARLSNPMDPYTKAMKKVSSKRKKTDDDHIELARLEFLGGLYWDDQAEVFYLPSENWESTLVEAAKKTKQGKLLKSAVLIHESSPLKIDGPQNPEARWKDPNCVDQRSVRVTTSRIIRTRPIFKTWSCIVKVEYHEDLIDAEALDDIFTIAGEQIGIGDYRPKFGRFEVKNV